MGYRQALGKEGEDRALTYLQGLGYEIQAVNWRCRSGELDIVACYKEQLIVVEVKTRTTLEYGTPQDAIDDRKIQSIIKVTQAYLAQSDCDYEVRFDIITLYKQGGTWDLEHLEDAFYFF